MAVELDRPIKCQCLAGLVRRESIVAARRRQFSGPLEMHGQRFRIRPAGPLELAGQTPVQFAPPVVGQHVDHGFPDSVVVGLDLVE